MNSAVRDETPGPSTQNNTRCVLIVEDEPDIAAVMRMTLEREGFATEWCARGEDALQRIQAGGIDLIILDIILPGIDGHEVCRRIRAADETRVLPIIMLTSLVEETDMIVGFELGADDYVRKPYSAAELVARTRAALRCRSQLSSQNDRRVLRFGSLEIDAARHRVQVDGQTTHLTLAEYRLLLFLASNFGQAFTRQELLPHVVGEGVFVIDRNIDVHVRNVRKKLGPSAHYIVTVRGIGYRFDAET